ncbi:L-ascorbate metabolism protein UlaG (beta-lactamase superfamily) [Diaminobutyricimonas aerilata]|uniref:L-ascorbate metabolism protein UlaG (Beta-lactamase superfamily) n=1 Tax=Diaminobutyricimonas aerilata TaxID=1162967 RepID=A0A2M9CFE1_9MICO|nr:MBL fold metallo-hydrolase [Diaminobutyricimonas aerilata]PJJ70570.1 L-ascorbate metabolism protein UlaG (beta-lactamase superfamily) [Diaminobutyricimonas aerilata]
MPEHTDRSIRVELIGGPTAVIDIGGLRFVTDPTFNPPGPQASGTSVLTKLVGPSRSPDELGSVDAVLLSHDQHGDNLDDAGRGFLATVPVTFSTVAAAERIGAGVTGLTPWQRTTLRRPDGRDLFVTAVPAVHGPDGMEASSGPVIGFVLHGDDLPSVYVSGDNASLRVVEEVAHHLGPITFAVLFGGGARVARLDAFLTLTSDQLPTATRLLDAAKIVPVHSEGWAHFTQDQASIRAAFDGSDVADRLVLLEPGEHAIL